MTGPAMDAEQRALLDALFDKWSLLVLDALCVEPRRFSELHRALSPITPKSLTETLRRLERNGMIHRDVRATSPVSVSYDITPLGHTVEEPLHGVLHWVQQHHGAVRGMQRRYDGDEGTAEPTG